MWLCAENRAKAKVYTLIELLVTITIIAILTSLFFAALKVGKEQYKAIACMDNLKNLGHVTESYRADNNRKYFIGTYHYVDSKGNNKFNTWTNDGSTFQLYLPGMDKWIAHEYFWCESDPYKEKLGYNIEPSYGYNDWNLQSISLVDEPSSTIFLADSGHNAEDGWRSYLIGNMSNRQIYLPRHPNKGANVLWCDGHVKARAELPQSDMWTAKK